MLDAFSGVDATVEEVQDAVRSGDVHFLQQVRPWSIREAARCKAVVAAVLESQQWDTLFWLIEHTAETGVDMCEGWQPLHVHVAKGSGAEALRAATDKDLQHHTHSHGSALHIAAMCGQVESVEYLAIERRLDLDDKAGSERVRPLHVAAAHGQVEVVERLVQLGADVNGTDCFKRTALFAAAKGGHPYVVEWLLRLGVDTLRRCKFGSTALHCAAASGSVSAVELLVQHGGVGVNLPGAWGATPLHAAVGQGRGEVALAIVPVLMRLGADVHQGDQDQRTALHYAASNGHVRAVLLLLSLGADLNAESVSGTTPAGDAEDWDRADVLAALERYTQFTRPMETLLVGTRQSTASCLTRFASHAMFEPKVLSLAKCFVTGEDNAAFAQLQQEMLELDA